MFGSWTYHNASIDLKIRGDDYSRYKNESGSSANNFEKWYMDNLYYEKSGVSIQWNVLLLCHTKWYSLCGNLSYATSKTIAIPVDQGSPCRSPPSERGKKQIKDDGATEEGRMICAACTAGEEGRDGLKVHWLTLTARVVVLFHLMSWAEMYRATWRDVAHEMERN